MEKYLNNWQPAKALWSKGGKIIKLTGFDAGEERRAKEYKSHKYMNKYPLIEWGWDRDKCLEAIDRVGLPRPGKSSCFFCPNSKPSEIMWLSKTHPDLYERAIKMEKNADLKTIKGLGRDYSWEELVNFSNSQIDMFESDWSTVEVNCECYDG